MRTPFNRRSHHGRKLPLVFLSQLEARAVRQRAPKFWRPRRPMVIAISVVIVLATIALLRWRA